MISWRLLPTSARGALLGTGRSLGGFGGPGLDLGGPGGKFVDLGNVLPGPVELLMMWPWCSPEENR